MPVVESDYNPKFLFKNSHFSTVYSGIFRNVNGVDQQRERIILKDQDFIDIDWSYASEKTNKLIIILHGLEGNAQRPYMLATAKLFNQNEIDAVCVNFRGCSGEPNLKYRSYHSGVTDDLDEVIKHIINTKHYSDIYIKGVSLGGNVTLKYLGEDRIIPKQIKGAVGVSVPCHLYGSCLELHTFKNILYANRFKKYLIARLRIKQKQFPEIISVEEIDTIKTLKDFDDVYTSKAHGFEDALDYYEKSSSLQFLKGIKVPTLILNALDDSFLSPECFPVKEAKNNADLFLEMPKFGGHVGFFQKNNIYYNERRSLEFINNMD
ncbi:MAG: alpha/beta fold hydrolase [Flavobacteriaceae bacterium]|nr:alpha/beta fold hydrolase [Bacteroidia bacterium]NNL15702.1 alpha/beta fold hydrolase [Flavobacteriaceae bacterium]